MKKTLLHACHISVIIACLLAHANTTVMAEENQGSGGITTLFMWKSPRLDATAMRTREQLEAQGWQELLQAMYGAPESPPVGALRGKQNHMRPAWIGHSMGETIMVRYIFEDLDLQEAQIRILNLYDTILQTISPRSDRPSTESPGTPGSAFLGGALLFNQASYGFHFGSETNPDAQQIRWGDVIPFLKAIVAPQNGELTLLCQNIRYDGIDNDMRALRELVTSIEQSWAARTNQQLADPGTKLAQTSTPEIYLVAFLETLQRIIHRCAYQSSSLAPPVFYLSLSIYHGDGYSYTPPDPSRGYRNSRYNGHTGTLLASDRVIFRKSYALIRSGVVGDTQQYRTGVVWVGQARFVMKERLPVGSSIKIIMDPLSNVFESDANSMSSRTVNAVIDRNRNIDWSWNNMRGLYVDKDDEPMYVGLEKVITIENDEHSSTEARRVEYRRIPFDVTQRARIDYEYRADIRIAIWTGMIKWWREGRAFSHVDSNHDGLVTREEYINNWLPKVKNRDVHRTEGIIALLGERIAILADANNDGFISEQEYNDSVYIDGLYKTGNWMNTLCDIGAAISRIPPVDHEYAPPRWYELTTLINQYRRGEINLHDAQTAERDWENDNYQNNLYNNLLVDTGGPGQTVLRIPIFLTQISHTSDVYKRLREYWNQTENRDQ